MSDSLDPGKMDPCLQGLVEVRRCSGNIFLFICWVDRVCVRLFACSVVFVVLCRALEMHFIFSVLLWAPLRINFAEVSIICEKQNHPKQVAINIKARSTYT